MLLLYAFTILTSTCMVSCSWQDDIHAFVSNATIADIRAALKSKTISCQALAAAETLRIQKYTSELSAYITYNAADIQEQAKAVDAAGVKETAKLTCVLMAVKDNIDVKGVPTTNGVKLMQEVVPSIDSFMVSRMREHQAIILGKANMAELSNDGLNSKSPVGGQCKNPYDLTRTCMGSSGGSGAAVAAGLATASLGTDTEGSVIGPANVNSLYGLRPGSALTNATFQEGVYPAFSRMDEVGFLTRNMDDMLTLQEAAYGKFTRDSLANTDGMKGVKVIVAMNMYENFSVSQVGIDYKADPDLITLHMKAYEEIGKSAEVLKPRMNLSTLQSKILQVLQATLAKPTCSKSCAKKSIDAYYGNSQRFPKGPFNSTESLFQAGSSGGLPSSYLDTLNFTIRQRPSDVCNDALDSSCKLYIGARATMTSFLSELLNLGNVTGDILAVPIGPKFAHKWNTVPGLSDQITASLNPYTGWPSITIPVGFSGAVSTEAPLGIPSGIVLISTPENTAKLLTFAYAYDKALFKFKLPVNFKPEIKTAANFKSEYLVNAVLLTIALLYIRN